MRRLIIVLGLVVGLLVGGCGRDDGKQAVNVVGSTSLQPFVELLAQEYGREHRGEVVEVQGGGSTAGLQAVATGLAHVGMCSRALKPEEREYTPIIMARDGLAIVVHPSNPVSGLTLEQLRGLFSGRITNWREVGGEDRPVWPITREEGSGTRESFVHLVMGKDERISRRALNQESNGAVKELVRGDPAAIGYMSLGLVLGELKALPVDGVEPTAANVQAGSYRLARPFLLVTKGPPTPAAQRFIDYVLSPAGQKQLVAEGLVGAQ